MSTTTAVGIYESDFTTDVQGRCDLRAREIVYETLAAHGADDAVLYLDYPGAYLDGHDPDLYRRVAGIINAHSPFTCEWDDEDKDEESVDAALWSWFCDAYDGVAAELTYNVALDGDGREDWIVVTFRDDHEPGKSAEFYACFAGVNRDNIGYESEDNGPYESVAEAVEDMLDRNAAINEEYEQRRAAGI